MKLILAIVFTLLSQMAIAGESCIKEVGKDNLKLSSAPTVLKFGAKWCPPCRALAPKLQTLSCEYKGKVDFIEVDVDLNPTLSNKWHINSLPTTFFIKNGKVIKSTVGDMTMFEIEELISDIK
jgi:thioredoxin 1